MEIRIVYKSDPLWIAWKNQLRFEKEFLMAAILVIEKNNLTGQAIVYQNPFHKIAEASCICLGNISLKNDKHLFAKIHKASVEIALKLGAKQIISPMDGSTWNNYRFVLYQPNAPFLLETTSEPYYIEQYKGLGYKTLSSYFSQETNVLTDRWERCKSRYDYFIKAGMKFDLFNLSKPKEEFRSLAKFCNEAFRKNFLFSPIQEEAFIRKMMQVVPILNPSYTIISRMNGIVTGFIFAYQDLQNKEEKSLIIKTLARDIDKPYGGLGAILPALVMKNAIRDGFTHCIHALMIDHNGSTTLSSNFNGKIRSRYELLYYTVDS